MPSKQLVADHPCPSSNQQSEKNSHRRKCPDNNRKEIESRLRKMCSPKWGEIPAPAICRSGRAFLPAAPQGPAFALPPIPIVPKNKCSDWPLIQAILVAYESLYKTVVRVAIAGFVKARPRLLDGPGFFACQQFKLIYWPGPLALEQSCAFFLMLNNGTHTTTGSVFSGQIELRSLPPKIELHLPPGLLAELWRGFAAGAPSVTREEYQARTTIAPLARAVQTWADFLSPPRPMGFRLMQTEGRVAFGYGGCIPAVA